MAGPSSISPVAVSSTKWRSNRSLLEKSSTRFHATGVAQRWLAPACEQRVFPAPGLVDQHGAIRAFEPLSPTHYVIDLNLKRLARSLGYHLIFRPAT